LVTWIDLIINPDINLYKIYLLTEMQLGY